MAINPGELVRREGATIEYSQQPLRLSWMVDHAFSQDGHLFIVTFSASLYAVARAADRQLLLEVLLRDQEAVTARLAIAHFASCVDAAVVAFARDKTASELMSDDGRAGLLLFIRAEIDKLAFACGCEFLAPFQIELRSPSLQSQKMESLIRAQAEQRINGQMAHIQRAGNLLQQFEALRESMPNTPSGKILQHLSIADQVPAFQSLLLATSQGKAPPLWAVSGQALVKIEWTDSEPVIQQFEMSGELGPLRSVQRGDIEGKAMLLVGARWGVLVVPEDDPKYPPRKYVEPGVKESERGFSAACLWNGHLCACHSEAGVVAWSLLRAEPTHRVHGEAARHLTPISPQLLLWCSGTSVRRLDVDFNSTSVFFGDDTILAILARQNDAVVLRVDGTGAVLNSEGIARPESYNAGGTITCAALLPWMGEPRVLAAMDNGPILCRGVDDPLITQYSSQHRSIRKIAASSHHVIALSDDRRRLIIWNSWDGQKPAREISLGAITRHRVADISF